MKYIYFNISYSKVKTGETVYKYKHSKQILQRILTSNK